jgi:ankyrin repeat protein
MITFLISKGADVNRASQNGNTPLKMVLNLRDAVLRIRVVQQLEKAGANPNSITNPLAPGWGYPPFEAALMAGKREALFFMLTNGLSQPARNRLLISAASYRHVDTVQRCIEVGADVNAKDSSGHTALAYAENDLNAGLIEI